MLCVYTWPHPLSFRGVEITIQQQLAWTVSINVSRPRSSFWTSVFSEMNWDFSWKNAKPRRREGWLWAGPGTTHIVTVECSGTAWRSQGDTRAMQRDLHCLHLPCTVGVWGSVMIVGDHTAVRRRVCESAVEEKLMEKREMLSLNAECQLTRDDWWGDENREVLSYCCQSWPAVRLVQVQKACVQTLYWLPSRSSGGSWRVLHWLGTLGE